MKLWLWWTLATIGGAAVGRLLANLSEGTPWVSALFHGAFGLGLGGALLQGLVLPGRWTHSVAWALATTLAGIVSSIVMVEAGTAFYESSQEVGGTYFVVFLLTSLGTPFLVATCQWLVLRRLVRRAGWWVPVSGLSLFLGWLVAGSIELIVLGTAADPSDTALVVVTINGIIYGAVTGYLLVRLRRSRSPDAGDTLSARP